MKVEDKITDLNYNESHKNFEEFRERVSGIIYKQDSDYTYVKYKNEKCKYVTKLLEEAIQNGLVLLEETE